MTTMPSRTALLAMAASALVATGCGGDSKDDKPSKDAASASSMDCLIRSVESPKLYDSAKSPGVEQGVRPLLTPGFKGGEILTGELGGVVIEYPTADDAQTAFRKANRPGVLGADVDPPKLLKKTLFIDYTHDRNVVRIVTACALHPEKPPPSPV